MERLLLDLSINVTAMFRDPTFFRAFRELVVPLLRTYPFSRLWVAGCSTGEEVYSFAIVLAEEGLSDRVRIYATDINQNVVDIARRGVFPLDKMQEYTQNYIRGGGTRSFSEYYVARYDGARFSRSLVDSVVFAQHNLASDAAFNEFQAIACRNVMIYFDRPLQEHVHTPLLREPCEVRRARTGSEGDDPVLTPRGGVRGAGRGGEAVSQDPMSPRPAARTMPRSLELPIGSAELRSDRDRGVVGRSGSRGEAARGHPGRARAVDRRRPAPGARLGPRRPRVAAPAPHRPAGDRARRQGRAEPQPCLRRPRDYHLLVDGNRFALSIDERVQYARPSIDVLFESVAEAYRERAIGIVLTGTNEDGARGLAAIKLRGGVAVVQDPRTAERRQMPEAAIAAAEADAILPIEDIPALPVRAVLSMS